MASASARFILSKGTSGAGAGAALKSGYSASLRSRTFSTAVKGGRSTKSLHQHGPTLASSHKLHRALFSTSSARLHETDTVVESGTLSSPSDVARKLSEAALPRIPRPNVKKVLVVGSGGLSIGQAGEFDYSGESVSCSPSPSLAVFSPFLPPPSHLQRGTPTHTSNLACPPIHLAHSPRRPLVQHTHTHTHPENQS